MNRQEALKIARIAYKDISQMIEKWENKNTYEFSVLCHWDGCISVNDELFSEWELREKEIE